jgi:hypothetical protein
MDFAQISFHIDITRIIQSNVSVGPRVTQTAADGVLGSVNDSSRSFRIYSLDRLEECDSLSTQWRFTSRPICTMKVWRGQPDNWTWKPTALELARAWIGLGGFFVLLALYSFCFRPALRGTGRWAWVHKVAFAAFGPHGDIVLYSLVGAAFLFFGIRKYRSARASNVT